MMRSRLAACLTFGTVLAVAGWTEPGLSKPITDAPNGNHPSGYIQPKPTEVVNLWPGDPPGLVAGGRPETIVNERYRDVSVPQLFVYLPPEEKACGVSVIICPGGGYKHLAMCLHVENVVALLHDRGIAVFGLKYRTQYGTNDVFADALADAKRAVQYVRKRAAEWHLDPQRIGIQGYSAGANLALNLTSHFDEGDPQAADPLQRISNRPDFAVLMCTWPFSKPVTDFPLSSRTPPAWIAIARDDTTAPYLFSTAIEAKLKASQVPVEMFVVESGGHSAFHYGMSPGPGAQWPDPFLAWLKRMDFMNWPGKGK